MTIKLGKILKHIVPASIIQQKLLGKRQVLFTFDDGPDPDITPKVLDIMDKYGARGLFFIPGIRIKRSPGLLKEIVRRNHGLANHSLSHTSNASLSFQELVKEINGGSDEIFSVSGIRTAVYRPPMGIVPLKLLFAAQYCKHKIMRWSLMSGEYSHLINASAQELADSLLNDIQDQAIVVSHDDHEAIPDFLELVIPRLLDRGFDLTSGLSSVKWRES
ncbi:MAG: polysaccharide deacetylase family protein [Candidatus Electrothrix sp. AR5]|nr:polysaccharide deacetylase family protein [Candidatus Electrothrix sp. AR5]